MVVFARESRQLLTQFALPKKNIYPTDRVLAGSVLLDDCFTGDTPFTAQVPDVIRLNPVWDLDVLVLREDGSRAVKDSQIEIAVSRQDTIPYTFVENRFTKTNIPLGTNVRVIFTLDDYYPEVKDYLSKDLSGWRVIDTVVLTPLTGEYASQENYGVGDIKHLYRPIDKNVVVHANDFFPSGNPVEKIRGDRRFRDGVKVNNDLTLCAHSDGGLYAYLRGSGEHTSFGSRLISPEGVAVSKDTLIYIADFGADRVVVFDTDGNKLDSLCTTGRNTATDYAPEVPGHLVLPTRVAIETDREGLTYDGQIVHRSDRILVADHNGLHRFDMLGYYLDTPVKKSNDWPAAGYLSGFEVIGYGLDSRIVIGNRQSGKLVSFKR